MQARASRRETTRPSKPAVLRASSMLNDLSREHRARLVEESFSAFASRGEMIWLAGWTAEGCGIIGEGFVKMTKTTPRGVDTVVEILGPGQAFGLLACIEVRSYPLSAVAATDVWYLKVPRTVLADVYEDSVPLKDRLVRALGPRLRKAHDMMGRLSSGRVENRLAAVIVILAESYGEETSQGVRLTLPLSRQDLSEMAGTTLETAIRIMSRWQREGVMVTEHQVITILDRAALQAALTA